MSERSWGSTRELCEQGARIIKTGIMPAASYRGFFSEVAE